jgi:hypothetical protein
VAYFRDAQEVYDTIGRLFAEIVAAEDGPGPSFRAADTVVRYEYTDPESSITVRLDEGEGEPVVFGASDVEPEVTMRMTADTAHRFWLGQVDITRALARGEITAEGPVAKLLRLVPLAKQAFPRYRAMLVEQGRTDLAEIR